MTLVIRERALVSSDLPWRPRSGSFHGRTKWGRKPAENKGEALRARHLRVISGAPDGDPLMQSTTMPREEILRVKLELLQREHRDLDTAIAALDADGRADPLTLRRLKKRKLHLKDQIARISDEITPDIIA